MTSPVTIGPATAHHGDMLAVLPTLEAESFHAVVCDPPYEIGFMSRKWDNTGIAFRPETWREVYRVLKPGAFCFAFGGARTQHRVAVALEDAGFVMHPCIGWVTGQGFSKGPSVGAAIDRQAGAKREVIGTSARHVGPSNKVGYRGTSTFREAADNPGNLLTAPATPEAAEWEGWRYGQQALRPCLEIILVAQRPYDGKPVDSIRRHGCGAFNIEQSRVGYDPDDLAQRTARTGSNAGRAYGSRSPVPLSGGELAPANPAGRYPSNLLHDGSPAVLAEFAKAGERQSRAGSNKSVLNVKAGSSIWGGGSEYSGAVYGNDTGTAARFFAACPYEPDDFPPFIYEPKVTGKEREPYNTHNTLKPIALLRRLIRLTLRPGQRLLDPFAGSGSTLIAAMREGVESVGVELEAEHFSILQRRLAEHHERLAADAAKAEAKRAQASLFAEAAA